VQSLLDSGWLAFQEQKPSVEKNPLSGYGGTSTSTNVDQVATIEQEHGDEMINLVHPCLPNEQIGNWGICKYTCGVYTR